jgi:hypothetical protein
VQAAAQPGMRYSVVTELMLRLLVRPAVTAKWRHCMFRFHVAAAHDCIHIALNPSHDGHKLVVMQSVELHEHMCRGWSSARTRSSAMR